MELSDSRIYLSAFDTSLYDLLHLRIVSNSFSSSASPDLLFRKQRECCRILLKGIKSCLVAPTYGNSHLIQCAVRKGSLSSLGELNKLLAKLDLEFLKKEVATLKVLQLCLSFSLEASLCLKWNKISKWLLQGGDVLRNNGAIPAVELSLLVAASQVCFTLRAGRLKVFPFDISELGLDQEILQYFVNDDNAVISSTMSSAVRLGATVHVLPSLRQASIESISRQIPRSCPYKQLSSFVEHWKFTYGLEIPSDLSLTYYVNVKFSQTGTTYTYPHWCVHSRSPVTLRRFDPTPILQDFINDVNELEMGLKLEVKGYKPVSSFALTDQVLSPAFQNLEAHLPAGAGAYRTVNPRPTLKQQSIFEMLKNIKSPRKNETPTFESHSQRQNSYTVKENTPISRPTFVATSSQIEICATPSEKAGRVQPFVSETASQIKISNVADGDVNEQASCDLMNRTGLPPTYFQSQRITSKLNPNPWDTIKPPGLGQGIVDKGKASHISKVDTEAGVPSSYFNSKVNYSKLPFKPRGKGRQTKLVPTIYIKTTDSEKMKNIHISESDSMSESEILKNNFINDIIDITASTADSIHPFCPNMPQGAVIPIQNQDFDFISKASSVEKKTESYVSDLKDYLVNNDKLAESQVNTSSNVHKESVLSRVGAVNSSACGIPSTFGDTGLVSEGVELSSGYLKSSVEKVTMSRTTVFHRVSSSIPDNQTVNSTQLETPQIQLNKSLTEKGDSTKLPFEISALTIQNALPSSSSQDEPNFEMNPSEISQTLPNNRLVNEAVKFGSNFMKASIEKGSTSAPPNKIVPVFVKKKVDLSAALKPIIEHNPKAQKIIPSFMLKKKPTFGQLKGKDESVKNVVRENDTENTSLQEKTDCRNDLDLSSKSAICLEKKMPIFSQNKIQKPSMSSIAFLKKSALDLQKKQKANKESIKQKVTPFENPVNASLRNETLALYFSSPTGGSTSQQQGSTQINSSTSKASLSTTEPSIFERLSELDLKSTTDFKALRKDLAGTGKKRKKNDNQSLQSESRAKKPRAPTKIATDVNVEELAKLGQLSIANVPTITAWLKAKGVQVKSKDKRQDLVNKVHQSLGLPVQF